MLKIFSGLIGFGAQSTPPAPKRPRQGIRPGLTAAARSEPEHYSPTRKRKVAVQHQNFPLRLCTPRDSDPFATITAQASDKPRTTASTRKKACSAAPPPAAKPLYWPTASSGCPGIRIIKPTNFTNYNQEVERFRNGKWVPVACRDFALAYAENLIGINGDFSQIATLAQVKNIYLFSQAHYDNDYFLHPPQEGYYFTQEAFGTALGDVCEQYFSSSKYTEHSLLFLVGIHMMALRMSGNKDGVVIHYYDPNITLDHRTIHLKSPALAKQLTLSDLWDSYSDRYSYWSNPKNPGVFMSPELETHPGSCKVRLYCLGHPPQGWLQRVIINGHLPAVAKNFAYTPMVKGDSKIKQRLQVALERNQVHLLGGLIKYIVNSPLSSQEKLYYLRLKHEKGHSLFHLPFQEDWADCVYAFAEPIAASRLSESCKLELLSAETNDGTSGLCKAASLGHLNTVREFTRTVLSSLMLEPTKVKLLTSTNSEPPPLYLMAYHDHQKMMETFMYLLLRMPLSKAQLTEVFKGLKTNPSPGCANGVVAVARVRQHWELLKRYQSIISGSALTPNQKQELLAKIPGDLRAK